MSNHLPVSKSEILFLYESTFSVPNGDPFTGEQRYDEETRKVLVSDVRIKRFIRDYLIDCGEVIYVINDKSSVAEGITGSGAALRMTALKKKFKDDPGVMAGKVPDDTTAALIEGMREYLALASQGESSASPILAGIQQKLVSGKGKPEKNLNEKITKLASASGEDKDKLQSDLKKTIEDYISKKSKVEIDALKIMQKCIDVRLFGGISTEEGDAVNLTGPVQFALLNPSLNSAELRIHQNTSVFSSSEEKSRGAIGTTTVVPYALNQIHGWINPYSARHTGLTESDINQMFKALWDSINNANTRTKSNQNSLLLLQIVYADPAKKLYGLDRLIKLNSDKSGKRDEQIRNSDDYELDFSKLKEAISSDKVSEVNFYTEVNVIKEELEKENKFKVMLWQ